MYTNIQLHVIYMKKMTEDPEDKKKEYVRIPDNMSLLEYILSLPDDEDEKK